MLLTPNAMSRGLRTGVFLTTALSALILLLPRLFILLPSFCSSQLLVFPPPGWTLK
ncbi:ABC transporter permease, partial [Pseudomonas syringae pv. tagetis]